MTTSPIADPGRIAVPQFGSRAEGRYNIIVVWDTPQVSSFRNYVGEAGHQIPTFLLYPGVMSRDKWRQWAVRWLDTLTALTSSWWMSAC